MTEQIDVVYVKIILNAILIGYVIFRVLYRFLLKKKRPDAPKPGLKYKILTGVFLSLLALASIFSYSNFGRLHGGSGQLVHYWEMFHYYMNAKYFKELGYLELYNAAVVADSEMDNQLGDGARLMDLRTYEHRTRADVLAESGAIKARFTPERWEQFKRDLSEIKIHDGRLADMVNDHGFNATPFWTVSGGLIANIVPVERLDFLALLDAFLMLVMFAFVFWAFGWETALASIAFFFANFFTSYYFLGGSFLRYDWLAAAVIGVCLLRKNKHLAAGPLLAASALLRIFPLLFSVFVGVKMIVETVREKRVPARYVKFFASFLAAALVFLLLLFSLGDPVSIATTYAERMELHNRFLLTNNVGLKMIVLADISNFDWPWFSRVYQDLDPTKDVFVNWNAWKNEQGALLLPAFIAIAVAAVALLGFIARRRDDAEAAAFGVILVFAVLAPTNYYYAFLVLLFMALFRREANLETALELCLLLAAVAAGFVIDLLEDFYLKMFLLVSGALLAAFLGIIGIEISGAVRRKKAEATEVPASPAYVERQLEEEPRIKSNEHE